MSYTMYELFMENKEDLKADIEMYFSQILDLCDLMLEADACRIPTILTIRGLAEEGLKKANSIPLVEG